MSNPIRTLMILSTLAASLGAWSAQATAEVPVGGTWAQSHPRRAEVGARLATQQARIRHEVREGELSPAQAARLSSEDRAIHRQAARMAARQDGHITAGQQARLNRELDTVGRDIPR